MLDEVYEIASQIAVPPLVCGRIESVAESLRVCGRVCAESKHSLCRVCGESGEESLAESVAELI